MNNPTPIGLVFPLRLGTQGYFQQSFDSNEQSRASLINLLSTRPGERRDNPAFGSKMYEFLFEQDIDQDLIQTIIQNDVAFWIPSITIQSIDINTTSADVDTYTIEITVNYTTNGVAGSVTISITP